jgi:hypothetical protein
VGVDGAVAGDAVLLAVAGGAGHEVAAGLVAVLGGARAVDPALGVELDPRRGGGGALARAGEAVAVEAKLLRVVAALARARVLEGVEGVERHIPWGVDVGHAPGPEVTVEASLGRVAGLAGVGVEACVEGVGLASEGGGVVCGEGEGLGLGQDGAEGGV